MIRKKLFEDLRYFRKIEPVTVPLEVFSKEFGRDIVESEVG